MQKEKKIDKVEKKPWNTPTLEILPISETLAQRAPWEVPGCPFPVS